MTFQLSVEREHCKKITVLINNVLYADLQWRKITIWIHLNSKLSSL